MSKVKRNILMSTLILCVLITIFSVVFELISYYVLGKPICIPIGLQNGVEVQTEMYMCLGGFLYEIIHEFDSGVISYFNTFKW